MDYITKIETILICKNFRPNGILLEVSGHSEESLAHLDQRVTFVEPISTNFGWQAMTSFDMFRPISFRKAPWKGHI